MKKRFVSAMCMVLCAALLASCGSGEAQQSGAQPSAAQSGGPENSGSASFSGWSADVFTPNTEYSWPQVVIDWDWPETGFEASVAELAFEDLDLKDTYTMGFRIAYENEKVLVFWSMEGIFAVELGDNGVVTHIFSLDFTKLFGRKGTVQGSHCTTVVVRKDGTRMLVGSWEEHSTEPMEDWYLVDIPTLTYRKSPIKASMTSVYETKDEALWSDEVFDEADAKGRVFAYRRLGEAAYILDECYALPLFSSYMEYRPYPGR